MHWMLDIIIIYFYVLIKNNMFIKSNVNENTTKAAETMPMIDYAKSNDCIFWIHLWQMSVNRASTILGDVSLVIKNWFARGYT